ncbi:MAG: 4Fe-4S dicluster domain-containing protein [Bacteroides sp.]|nr:4Fe-4S dicluster domain-containing protein [Bacteroides sp.]
MIQIKNKVECSGCAACEAICGHKCITMTQDDEGFEYPKVNEDQCVNCGLCDKVCPIQNIPDNFNVREVLAAKNKDPQQRFDSSSGGLFRIFAEDIIQNGGKVVGCKFDENMVATHALATKIEELQPLMSSKYVQSDIRKIFVKVRKLLLEGNKVLFVGVPCQVAALRNFLFKPYPNLITIDILCHGVPSPKIFREYINSLNLRYGSQVKAVNFRSKEKSWKRLFIKAIFKNNKRHFLYSGYDSYMQLFLSDRLQRPSCFKCPYNTLHRPGDISLGDFWGIGKKDYGFDDNKGISMVIINSEIGQLTWNRIKSHTDCIESDINTAIEGNKVLVQHLPTSRKRDEFYDYYVRHGYQAAILKFAPETPKHVQYYMNFMRWGLDIIRKLKKESY